MPNRLRSWWGTTIGSGPITREHPPLALLWLGLIALGPLLWNLSVTGPTTLGPGLDGELYYVTSPTAGWWAFPWWLALTLTATGMVLLARFCVLLWHATRSAVAAEPTER